MENPLLYIVDNDLISIFDIKIRLHQSSYEHRTKCFENTNAAFEMLAVDYRHIDGIPDVIMVNFDLAEMDGLAFINRLEQNGLLSEKTHIYIFSSLGITEKMKRVAQHKLIKGWFTKPVSGKDIKTIFNNLSDREAQQHLRAI